MLGTLRQRNFFLLWTGGLISMVGDWVLLIGLWAYVYRITGSTLAGGLMFIAQMVPGILFGSVAGVLADRWDRKRMLVVGNLLQALALLPLLAVRSAEQIWIVYAVGFVASTIGTLHVAENALLPRLVGEEHLVAANSLNALNNNVARLTGPPLGGAAVAFLGLPGVVLADAASFLIGAGMIALISAPTRPERGEDPSEVAAMASVWMEVWRDWIEGLRIVRGDRLVAGVFAVIAAAALADALATPLWIAFVYEVLGRGAVEFGWLGTAQGAGGIAGSFLLAHAGKRVGLRRLVALGAAFIGALELVMFNFPSLPLTLVLFPLTGAAVIGLYTGLQTLLQVSVEDRYRGRVFGAYGTTNSLLTVAGMGLGGALGDVLPVLLLMNASAVLYILTGVVARVVLRGPVTEIELEQAQRRGTPAAS